MAQAVQLPLALPFRTAAGAADFLIAECNRAAVGWIDLWPGWNAPGLVLAGPPGSGKTHLARVWAARSGARILPAAEAPAEPGATPLVLDAADDAIGVRAAEERLFHLYNAAPAAHLLILARRPPSAHDFALPDLASRLRAAPLALIAEPDDALLAALLVKQFADRQITPSPALLDYVLPRMERSFAAARDLVAALDRASLGRKRPVTVALARAVLDAQKNG